MLGTCHDEVVCCDDQPYFRCLGRNRAAAGTEPCSCRKPAALRGVSYPSVESISEDVALKAAQSDAPVIRQEPSRGLLYLQGWGQPWSASS